MGRPSWPRRTVRAPRRRHGLRAPAVAAILSLAAPPGPLLSAGPHPDPSFRRGDADLSGQVEVTDAVRVLELLFRAGDGLGCPDAADASDDGSIDILDALRILLALFDGIPLPDGILRHDPTPDGLGCRSGKPPCAGTVAVTRVGMLPSPEIYQPSGLGVSRIHPGTVWAVNDRNASRDPTLYAVSVEGSFVRSYLTLCEDESECPPLPAPCDAPLRSVHCDWESLAMGYGPDGSPAIYVGDTGTDDGRSIFAIHRVPEPPVLELRKRLYRSRGDFQSLFYRVEETSGFDAEALVRDPASGDLYVLAHSPAPALYRYPPPERPGEVVSLLKVGDLTDLVPPGDYLSGADISPSGDRILLKTWTPLDLSVVLVCPWRPDDPAAGLRPQDACAIELGEFLGRDDFHAGAIVWDSDRSFLTCEEELLAEVDRIEL